LAVIGSLHARADAGGEADDNISVDAHATAAFGDHIAIDDPILGSAMVKVHVPLKISGVALAQKSVSNPAAGSFARASALYSAIATVTKINGEFITSVGVGGHAVAPDDFSVDDDTPLSDEFLLDVDVRANEFFEITLSLTTFAHFEFSESNPCCDLIGSGNAFAFFQHSFVWGGIRSVTDPVTGLPIEGWSVVSSSGADYSKSFEVPEPAAWLLVVGTVAGLSLQSGSRCPRKNSNRSSALDFVLQLSA
jgi:hypothetical protein